MQRRRDVKNLSLITATLILAVTATAAGTGHYTATLAQPLTAKKEFIANSNIWDCDGSTCILTSVPTDPDSVRSCRELQRRVGALTAYGKEGKPFDGDKLAKCNAQG
jgi:hypothetical protein